jgi:hypothetical protein
MRRFEYRPPRFPADVSVKLNLQDFTMTGRCVEISLEGMRGRFDKPLELKALGSVTIAYRDLRIDVPVQVAHRAPDYEGLTFLFDSDVQRDSVQRLIGLITETPAHHGLALVKL